MRGFDDLTIRGRGLRLRRLAAKVADNAYGLSDAGVRLVSMHSFNNIFRIDPIVAFEHENAPESSPAMTSRGVLRVGDACRIHMTGVEDIEAEWLDDLAKHGFAVPQNVSTVDGRRWTTGTLSGVPGSRTCSMFTWVPGRPLATVLSAERIGAAGRLLAQLHEHASGFTPRRPMPEALHSDRVVYFHKENRVLDYESVHGDLFCEAIDRAQGVLGAIWKSPPHAPHLLHGDFGPNNILVARGQLQVIDFQDLQFGFDIQDLGITLDALDRHVPDGIDAFREGYMSMRPWPELAPELLAAFAAARSLNVMNLGLHLRKAGIAEFLDGHAERVAAWMQTAA